MLVWKFNYFVIQFPSSRWEAIEIIHCWARVVSIMRNFFLFSNLRHASSTLLTKHRSYRGNRVQHVHSQIWLTAETLKTSCVSLLSAHKRQNVLNHGKLDCFFNILIRRTTKKTWKLHITWLVCGMHWWVADSPLQRPILQIMASS